MREIILKTPFLFLLLCLALACQREDLQPNASEGVSQQPITHSERLLPVQEVHPSILESAWWQGLSATTQQLVKLELAQSGKPLTMPELQERLDQAWVRAAVKTKVCPSYPAGNPAGDVILNSQSDVDAFGALNCKEIVGALEVVDTLGPDPICDLSPLGKIKEVGSSLTVNSDCLTSLTGLDKIKSVGQAGPFGFVGIIGANLTDIEALAKLSTVTGSINIINCDQLVSISQAFSKITTIESGKTSQPLTSIFVLNIDNNDLLTDISAFGNLTYLEGSLRILSNSSLTDLDDLSGLNDIGNSIFVFNNAAMQNVNELSNISSLAEDLFVLENPSLIECCGLYSLLCSNPPSCSNDGVGDDIVIFNNGAGCTEMDIISNGPCP